MGDTFLIWLVDPGQPRELTHWRQSSTVASITRDTASAVEATVPRGRGDESSTRPFELAQRYNSRALTWGELKRALARVDFLVEVRQEFGYDDLPDRGAWVEVDQALFAGLISDDQFEEIAGMICHDREG